MLIPVLYQRATVYCYKLQLSFRIACSAIQARGIFRCLSFFYFMHLFLSWLNDIKYYEDCTVYNVHFTFPNPKSKN